MLGLWIRFPNNSISKISKIDLIFHSVLVFSQSFVIMIGVK